MHQSENLALELLSNNVLYFNEEKINYIEGLLFNLLFFSVDQNVLLSQEPYT